MRVRKNNIYIATLLMIVAIMVSCSTTRRLEDDDILYTGVKKIEISTQADSIKLPANVVTDLKATLNVSPNNAMPLLSPYMRTPFPVGLWVYNNWNMTENSSSIKKWLYNQLVREPVLISTVRPQLRMKALQEILNSNGYFGSTTEYAIVPDKRNPRKAKLSYRILAAAPRRFSSIELLPDSNRVTHIIDSLAQKSSYLQCGGIYNTDSLEVLRTDITNYLRNHGYYYFKPEYLKYLADSVSYDKSIAIRMIYADGVPQAALRKYYTGNVTVSVLNNDFSGIPDTITTRQCKVIQWKPSRLRDGLIPSCITFRKGREFSVRNMTITQSHLSRIGIFQSINIDVAPIDSVKPDKDTLDVKIGCIFDKPLEASLEVAANYKSNSYIGPELRTGIAHNNLFGGGERLSFTVNGAYEWQIGKASSTTPGGNNNYYEFGLGTTLAFPRLLAPQWIARSRRDLNWSEISLNANIYNNPSSLKFMEISLAYTYKWRSNRHITNELSLPSLKYSKRLRSVYSESDDIDYNDTERVWEYYTRRSVFIPTINYTITYDNSFGSGRRNSVSWRNSIAESGNILSGIWSLAGKRNGGVESKELFGVPFSQFIRIQSQLVYSRTFTPGTALVSRALVGAGFVYGNSNYMPYGEDFYAGGPNTIRAFGIKSLGPGSFSDVSGINSQFLHSGSFQLILNSEYRFPIYGLIHGAAFVDAGNVWLLKDPKGMYSGGVLTARDFLKDIALGTGFGLRLDLSMLIVRADLGIGLHAPYDTGKSGYYNMTSLKNSLALNIAIGYPF